MKETSDIDEPNAFIRWKHTWLGRLVWLLIDAVIVYSFVSLAIDSGSLWQWGLALFFLVDCIYNFVQCIRAVIRHDRQATTAK